jgi:hypothetical protein
MQHVDPKIIKLLRQRADLNSPSSDSYKALADAANVLAAGNLANPNLPAIHTIDDYQRAAAATAVYPKDTAYPFLGIAGECGELIEVLIASRVDYDRMVKELGDVCWYFAAVCRDVWTDNPHAMASLCVEYPCPYETWAPSRPARSAKLPRSASVTTPASGTPSTATSCTAGCWRSATPSPGAATVWRWT